MQIEIIVILIIIIIIIIIITIIGKNNMNNCFRSSIPNLYRYAVPCS